MIRTLTIPTPGRGFIGITGQVAEVVAESGVREGLCTVFIRHTSASLLLSAGVHPKVVQERLGHSQIGITLDIYSHVLPTMGLEAAAKLETMLTPKRQVRE